MNCHLIDWRASVRGAETQLLLIALLGLGHKTLLQAPRRPVTDAWSLAGGAGPAQSLRGMWQAGGCPEDALSWNL